MQPPIHHRGCMLSLHFPEGCEFFRGIAAKRDNGKDVSPSWAFALPLFRLLLARMLFPYRESVRTITTDNGCEFAAHLEITRLLSIKGRDKVIVYFADSYCSWVRVSMIMPCMIASTDVTAVNMPHEKIAINRNTMPAVFLPR